MVICLKELSLYLYKGIHACLCKYKNKYTTYLINSEYFYNLLKWIPFKSVGKIDYLKVYYIPMEFAELYKGIQDCKIL